MKRNVFAFIISIVCLHLTYADDISKTMAVQEVKDFLLKQLENGSITQTQMTKRIATIAADIDTSKVENYSLLGIANMYRVVFDGGWALLSTQTAIKPILAYSLHTEFPNDDAIPEGLKWLFAYYENVIAYAKDSIAEPINAWKNAKNNRNSTTEESKILAALGDVKWGQSNNNSNDGDCNKVYNKYCPTFHSVSCSRTIVGCGAVALGQVLWYYQWPHYGLIPTEMLNDNGSVSTDEEFKYYNWEIFPTQIFTSTPIDKINMTAGLLRDCGYAEHMEYGSSGSNTYVSAIKTALEHSFGYENIQTFYRPHTANWINRMKNEIRNGRPVIYRGGDPNGAGHFFILYGFTGDYFNINWGWLGSYNNIMCTLDALNVNNTNYNSGHYAIVNIAPTYPNCSPLVVTSSYVLNNNFVVQNGGSITIGNRTISNGQQGIIYSGDFIRLTAGFHIQQGANVHIAIRDMHCNNREDNSDNNTDSPTTNRQQIKSLNSKPMASISPIPATVFVTISFTATPDDRTCAIQIHDIYGRMIYENSNYPLVSGNNEITINTSSYPTGLYIASVRIADETQSIKFLKQ